MTDLTMWAKPIEHFFSWLKKNNPITVKKFVERIGSSDQATAEGAAAEALVWDFLDNRELELHSGEDHSGGPDFLCKGTDGEFYVEVTNMARPFVSRLTNLPDPDMPGARCYGTLTRQVKKEIIEKAGQFEVRGRDKPLVVFVTTLHSPASSACFQPLHVQELHHSELSYTWRIDSALDGHIPEGHLTSDMAHSLWTFKNSLTTTRQHISAVVVAGFGFVPPQAQVRGVLHPDASRPFDPRNLIDVDFCQFKNWPQPDLEWLEFARPHRRAVPDRFRAVLRQLEDENSREIHQQLQFDAEPLNSDQLDATEKLIEKYYPHLGGSITLGQFRPKQN